MLPLFVVCVVSVAAPEPARSETPRGPYNGASFGPEVHAGFGRAVPSRARIGSVSVGFRHSLVFLFGDSRISYVFDGSASEPRTPDRHAFWLHTCIHPLAPALLWSDWLGYVLASPYFEIGAGGLLYADAFPGSVASPAFGWSLGGGIDIPLANPDHGQAPWLQVIYRYRTDSSNLGDAGGRARSHVLYTGLGWRFNGTLF